MESWEVLRERKAEGGLGLGNLSLFNPKQAWNTVTDPSTLLARLYKILYFISSFFSRSQHRRDALSILERSFMGQIFAGQRFRMEKITGMIIGYLAMHHYYKLY